MKKMLFLAIACLTFTIAHAHKKDSTIVFNKTVHDFGELEQGLPQTYTFEFTNTGTKELIIEYVHPDCGCTSSGWTKEPVKPGEKGYVIATYNAVAAGRFEKSLTVKSNGKPGNITLRLKGSVKIPEKSSESK